MITSERFGQNFFDPRQLGSVNSRLRKIFPFKNTIFFNFFSFWAKKISLSQVKKYPGQRQIGLLFTGGQKYARMGSGPISSLIITLTYFMSKFRISGETLRHRFMVPEFYSWILSHTPSCAQL